MGREGDCATPQKAACTFSVTDLGTNRLRILAPIEAKNLWRPASVPNVMSTVATGMRTLNLPWWRRTTRRSDDWTLCSSLSALTRGVDGRHEDDAEDAVGPRTLTPRALESDCDGGARTEGRERAEVAEAEGAVRASVATAAAVLSSSRSVTRVLQRWPDQCHAGGAGNPEDAYRDSRFPVPQGFERNAF